MPRPSIIKPIHNNHILSKNTRSLLQNIHRPIAKTTSHTIDIDPLIRELPSITTNGEAKATREFEAPEILGVDFKMIDGEFIVVVLRDAGRVVSISGGGLVSCGCLSLLEYL